MEVSVGAVETSDGKNPVKKSRNGESKVAVEHPGEKKCNEERKESENHRSHSKTNEFSLERKLSFKELRKRAGELEDAPDLSSRQGQVSLVLESNEKVDKMENTREERKHPEGNVKEEPVNLHLSQIKIQQWTKPNVKQNDEEPRSRIKQICSALEGDDIYHYENIDDFDDTTENYQPNCKHFKRSPLRSPPKQHISCKYKIAENGNDLVTTGVTCKGFPDDPPAHETDLRLYFIGEFARKAETVRCLQRGCDNLYDPWDVLEFAGTKQARTWFLNSANDPLGRKHTTELPPITRKHYYREREYSAPPGPANPEEYESLMNWMKGKPKKKKFKLFKLPKTSVFINPLKANATGDARIRKLLEYKHVCTYCLEGINEEPEPGGLTCGHYTCRRCLHQYFKDKMKKKITRMECPHRGCHQRFRTLFILDVLDYIPLRVAYLNLCDEKRKEMGLEKAGSTSSSSSEDDHDKPIICTVPNSSSNNSLKSSQDCKECPGCNNLTQRHEDFQWCNIVLCSFCRTKFCWICGKTCIEVFHMYKCPLYGTRTFGKGRRIANFVGYSSGLAIGVPIVGSFAVGTGAVALATLVALGALSPPVLLTRKIHKYHKHHTFSVSKRRLWILGGASLGVLALPVLSAWGVYRTVVAATRKAEEILHRCLPANDDDDFSHQTFKVDTNALGLYRDGLRDATGDKNANDHIKPQLKQIETTPES